MRFILVNSFEITLDANKHFYVTNSSGTREQVGEDDFIICVVNDDDDVLATLSTSLEIAEIESFGGELGPRMVWELRGPHWQTYLTQSPPVTFFRTMVVEGASLESGTGKTHDPKMIIIRTGGGPGGDKPLPGGRPA